MYKAKSEMAHDKILMNKNTKASIKNLEIKTGQLSRKKST